MKRRLLKILTTLTIGLLSVTGCKGLVDPEMRLPGIMGTGEKTTSHEGYLVTFFNYDDSVLYESYFKYGETPAYYGPTPTRPSTEYYQYVFIGWDRDFEPVRYDTTYYAQYEQTLREYDVSWRNYDGSLFYSEQYHYYDYPSYKGPAPERYGNNGEVYIFIGWTPNIDYVTCDVDYCACFTNNSLYGVAITNKAALQEEWHVGGAGRDIDINLTPAGNVALEIAKKNLRITSSNSEVVLANGVALTPVGEGTATITVEYYDAVDSVNLIVLAEKSEPEHVRATVADIVDNLNNGKEKDVIYDIEVYVVAWQSGKPDATKYGNYMIADSMDSELSILVYGSSANTEAFTLSWNGERYSYSQTSGAVDFLTNNITKDVWIGSKLEMQVIAYMYNGTTPEVSGIVLSADNSGSQHNTYVEPDVVNATMEEVWNDERGSGKVKFHVTNVKLFAFATNKGVATESASKYGNALLGDEGQYFAYGLTITASALAWYPNSGVYSFTNPQDFTTNELTKVLKAGAIIDLDLIRADYGDKKEVTGIITKISNYGDGINVSETLVFDTKIEAGEGYQYIGGFDCPDYIRFIHVVTNAIAANDIRFEGNDGARWLKDGAIIDMYGNVVPNGSQDYVIDLVASGLKNSEKETTIHVHSTRCAVPATFTVYYYIIG